MRKRDRYKPAASKTTLLSLAGILWLCIGSMLLHLAVSWLQEAENINPYLFACPGVILGFFIYYFGFSKIVFKNTARILHAEEKMCVFAFMPLKSFLIIPIMISMGAILRHSPIPKQYLAILYTGIGSAMLLSSIKYLRVIMNKTILIGLLLIGSATVGADVAPTEAHDWTLGQALMDKNNPSKIIDRLDEPVLYAEQPWEMKGFYSPALVANGLVFFKGEWLLYYGGADRWIGLATYKPEK